MSDSTYYHAIGAVHGGFYIFNTLKHTIFRFFDYTTCVLFSIVARAPSAYAFVFRQYKYISRMLAILCLSLVECYDFTHT